MPKVGKKEFEYTGKGKEKAKKYAKKTGQKMEKYQMGGIVNPMAPSGTPPYGDDKDSPQSAIPMPTAPIAPVAPVNPYNIMDARNRSQMYMEEGGKVDNKKK